MPVSGNSSEVHVYTSPADAAARCDARLLQQYKDATVAGVKEVLHALGWEVQSLETAADSVLTATLPPSAAEGINLDRLGAIVGEPRAGRTDTAYRPWLEAKIRANRSSGSIDDLIAVLAALIGSSAPSLIKVDETPPAAAIITVSGALSDPVQTSFLLRIAKKAGVRIELVYSSADDAYTFCFANGPGLGFGAGNFASVIGV